MKKPNNYDNTQASGDFTPIELGGHVLVIKEVLETQSRSGKEMLKVSFDFAQSDSQPGYFEKAFRDDIRPDKKWPVAGTTYILTEDQDGNCSRQFKTFTTSVEKSNIGFSIPWDERFAQSFKNKLVGGVFGEVEEEYNGAEHTNRRLRWFRSTERIKEVDIPEKKELRKMSSSPTTSDDGFMNIPDGIDEELPFV